MGHSRSSKTASALVRARAASAGRGARGNSAALAELSLAAAGLPEKTLAK